MRLSILHAVMAAVLMTSAASAAEMTTPEIGQETAISAKTIQAPSPAGQAKASALPARPDQAAHCRKSWQEATSVCDAGNGRCTMAAGVQYGACLKRGA